MTTSKETQVNDIEESKPPVQPNPQVHQFFSVTNEAKRIYIFPNNEQLVVDGVYAISIDLQGNHRLFSKQQPNCAFKVSRGWLTIQYFATEGNYVFSTKE